MPTVQIHLPAGQEEATKASLIQGLTKATVDALSAPIEAVRIMIEEYSAANQALGGVHASAVPPVMFAILIAGRTDAQKAALVARLTEACTTSLGVPAADVTIFVKDIPNTDFGLGGKTAKSLGR
ncbi:tautomerase family protein [Burkholderia sp. Ac-20353]|uniref:tautomerase family protein n=1 Tax=Burkholderia sp. Ac-20353 TaxID=2703894 RepID=UPI00197C087D|nr:tautomerase family protein [Burkholderia sp. Ac-20353]MBN3787683.1 4-oxalocrotonate tautomerase [Burkholderia sp. Ac-20353]